MFKFFKSAKYSNWILFGLLFLGVFPALFIEINTGSATPADRDRAMTRLREAIERADGKPSEEQLIDFERNFAKTKVAALSRFLRAYLKYSAGDFQGSAPIFDESIVKEGTELGDYALCYQGRAYREAGNFERARAAFLLLAEKYPQSLFHSEAQVAAGELSLKLGDPKRALKLMAKPLEAKDPAALLISAQCYEQLNDQKGAAAAYRKLYYERPESKESEQAAVKLAALGIILPEAGEVGFKSSETRANRLYETGQFVLAADAFALLFSKYPEAMKQSKDHLRYGASLYNAGRFRDALKPLSLVSSSEKALYVEALCFTALSNRKLKAGDPFADAAAKAISLGAPANKAPSLLAGLVDHHQTSNPEAAARFRLMLIKDYPNTKDADEASYKLAWKLHKENRYEQASRALIEHVADIPNSDYRGLSAFWAGRDAERAGKNSTALTIYEAVVVRYLYGYYGQLAAQRISELKRQYRDLKPEKATEGSALAQAVANLKPAAPLPETMTEKAEPRLQRAANLQSILLGDLALVELDRARRDAPASPRINLEIARIYRSQGENLKAVTALQRAHPDYTSYRGDEAPREVFEIFFPLIEWKTIKAEAARHKLDPYLIAGLIRQESVFDPSARSRANALGLMQLLPSTGKLVARKQGSGVITSDQLYNPQLNIKLGTAYFADMLDKFGRIEYAAAAYNGGPGRVDRWLKTLPSEIEDWVDAIPITETRLYVQGVLRNTAHYRRLYSESNN